MGVVEEGFLYAVSNEVGEEYVQALLVSTVLAYAYFLANGFGPWKPSSCHCQPAVISDKRERDICGLQQTCRLRSRCVHKDLVSYKPADSDLYADHPQCGKRWHNQ